MFPHAEGYVNVTEEVGKGGNITRGFVYVYNYTDHLGNVRMSYDYDNATSSLKILEENHYYPFGLKHTNYNSDLNMIVRSEEDADRIIQQPPFMTTNYKYKYNGKELQDELGLNLYDLGARNYDPALGRFFTRDPKEEEYSFQSTYAISVNNPVFHVDINGEGVENDYTLNVKTGEVKLVKETNDTKDRIVKLDKKGDVKKVEIDNIAKGILQDGQNFKKDDVVVDVNGTGKPKLEDVEKFALDLAEHIGKEIPGMYLSKENKENAAISKVYFGRYELSYSDKTSFTPIKYNTDAELRKFYPNTHFHTHPTIGHSKDAIENPSKADLDYRDGTKQQFKKFLILHKAVDYPYELTRRYYTND